MNAGIERVRKLRWLCRRGMKELDILLENFVEAESARISKGAWPEFEAMLRTEDDMLWDWIQDPGRPDAAGYHALLEHIRRGTD
jgi:antitoxin CptB